MGQKDTIIGLSILLTLVSSFLLYRGKINKTDLETMSRLGIIVGFGICMMETDFQLVPILTFVIYGRIMYQKKINGGVIAAIILLGFIVSLYIVITKHYYP